MNNLLTLHEAVVVVLLKKPDYKATFEEIALEIERRGLYPIRKGNIELAQQIKLRTAIKSSNYLKLFRFYKPDTIQLEVDADKGG
jgi:hypothetical protein